MKKAISVGTNALSRGLVLRHPRLSHTFSRNYSDSKQFLEAQGEKSLKESLIPPKSKKPFFKRWWFLIAISGAIGYIIYRELKEFYFNFSITHIGEDPPPSTTTKLIQTSSQQQYYDILKSCITDDTKMVVVYGAPGTGKTVAIAESYSKPGLWYHHPTRYGSLRRFINQFRRQKEPEPWLRIWIGLSDEDSAAIVENKVQNVLINVAARIESTSIFSPPLGKLRLRDKAYLFVIKRLPPRLQSYFKFDFVENNIQGTLDRLKQYLEDHPGWMIVVDNVPDRLDFCRYLPQKGGVLVISTNNKDLALPGTKSVEFAMLSKPESMAVANLYLGDRPQNEVAALVELFYDSELGGLPLGIAHGCAYIINTGLSVEEYARQLEKSPSRVLRHKSSVATKNLSRSLELTLEKFRNLHQNATFWSDMIASLFGLPLSSEEKLLFLISLLAPVSISEKILNEALNDLDKGVKDFEITRAHLTQYKLVERNAQGNLKMHSTYHKIFRDIAILDHDALKAPTSSIWRYFRSFFVSNLTYLNSLAYGLSTEKIDENNIGLLLENIFNLEKLIDEADKGCFSSQRALVFYKYQRQLDDYIKNNFNYRQRLAINSQNFQRLNDKQKLLRRADSLLKEMKILDEVKDAKLQIWLLNDLAMVYRSLGRKKESLVYILEAVRKSKKIFGDDDVQTAMIKTNLAIVYSYNGEHQLQISTLEEVIPVFEKRLGRQHWETARAILNLGSGLISTNQCQKAKELLNEALAIYLKFYDENHIKVADIYSNLASAEFGLRNFKQQKNWLKLSVSIFSKTHGPEHYLTAWEMMKLGGAYGPLGQYEKAEKILTEALSAQRAYYGVESNREIAFTLINLAEVFEKKGEHAKRLDYLLLALAGQEKHFGRRHATPAQTLYFIADAYHSLNDKENEVKYLKEAYDILKDDPYEKERTSDIKLRLNIIAKELIDQDSHHSMLPHF